MKLRKTLFLLTIAVSVFAVAGIAFAANRIEVKVTSQPIPYDDAQGKYVTTCEKAGGFSFAFDAETIIRPGDLMTIDLNVGATLCRDIDIEISRGDVVNPSWTLPEIYENDDNGPIYYSNQDPAQANEGPDFTVYDANDVGYNFVIHGNNPPAGYDADTAGVYFQLYGKAGTRRLTLEVLGEGAIEVGDEPGDQLILLFLDQRVNGGSPDLGHDPFVNNGIWNDIDVDGNGDPITKLKNDGFSYQGDNDYGEPNETATIGDNTFCINPINFPGESIKVNLDSKGDKFSFAPSDPTVAHPGPMPGVGPVYNFTTGVEVCVKTVTGTIPITQIQGADCLFDYEDPMGYCNDHVGDNRFILTSDRPFDSSYTYTINLEILVNANAGDNGVYWTNEDVGINSTPTTDLICDDIDHNADEVVPGQIYGPVLNDDGDRAVPAVGNCAETNRARIITTNAHAGLNIDDTDDNLWIDFPTLAYNSSMVSPGQSVTVRVTLTGVKEDPTLACGGQNTITIGPFDVKIGTFVNTCGTNFSLVYPYFTEDGGAWWNGVAITNLGNQDGTATLYFHENDGDVGVVSISVPANGIFADLKENVLAMPGMVTTPAGATLGNSRAYMVICADFDLDGFVMLGNYQTGEGQGYIPRMPAGLPVDCR